MQKPGDLPCIEAVLLQEQGKLAKSVHTRKNKKKSKKLYAKIFSVDDTCQHVATITSRLNFPIDAIRQTSENPFVTQMLHMCSACTV